MTRYNTEQANLNREDQQSHAMDMQRSGFDQQNAYQQQMFAQQKAMQQAQWSREDIEKAQKQTEQADFAEGAFAAMRSAGMTDPKMEQDFASGNLQKKLGIINMAQSRAYADWKEQQQRAARANTPPSVQEIPGTGYVYASPGDGHGGTFLPKPADKAAAPAPPEGFVPRSYNPRTGTTYGPPPQTTPRTIEVPDPATGERKTMQWDPASQRWIDLPTQAGPLTGSGLY